MADEAIDLCRKAGFRNTRELVSSLIRATESEEIPAAPPEPMLRSESRRPRLLVVDDTPLVLRALALRLGQEYEVRVAEGGSEARRLLALGSWFDVILCDLLMPEVSGIDLYWHVRTTNFRLARRFVFLTGAYHDPFVRSFANNVDNVILQKPPDPEKLSRAIGETASRS